MSTVLPWVSLALQLAILAVMFVICHYARRASRDASQSQADAFLAAARAEDARRAAEHYRSREL